MALLSSYNRLRDFPRFADAADYWHIVGSAKQPFNYLGLSLSLFGAGAPYFVVHVSPPRYAHTPDSRSPEIQ